ncbi:MAG TPA: serine hydrolase domain-containing protein [Hyphomonadaceae bacterium]|nr:serine hydrolase domain-containing protein [Hyphomonadaceae bacterium]
MHATRTIAFAALALIAACNPVEAPAPAVAVADPAIAKFETSLASPGQVTGEPAETWSLTDRMAHYNVPGVSIAIIKDGKIDWQKAYGVLEAGAPTPVNTDTLFQAGSISKPTAVIAALRMVEQGQLSLDAPINDFLKSWKLPDNAFTQKQPVTPRLIMSHGAGLTVHGFPGYEAGAPLPTIPQILDGQPPANTAAVRVDKLPGESWRYSGGGTTILQLAMTDVSGKDFPTLTHDLVLAPAGMTRSSYVNPLPEANRANAATAHHGDGTSVAGHAHIYPEMAAAGLWTTPGDLARLALTVVADARGDKDALLGPEITRQMLTTQIGTWGLGFELDQMSDGQVFSHGGSDEGFEAFLYAYTDGHGGAAIMTNGQNGAALAQEIRVALAATYGWKYGAPEMREAVALTPERAQQFAGDYVLDGFGKPMTLIITAEGEKLWYEVPTVFPKQRFYVASDTQAFAVTRPTLAYTTNRAGQVDTIEVSAGAFAKRKQ